MEEEMKPGCSSCILHAYIIARMDGSANTVTRSPCQVPTIRLPMADVAHRSSSNQVCLPQCFERLRVCQRDLQPAPPRGPPGTLSSSLVCYVRMSSSSYWRGAEPSCSRVGCILRRTASRSAGLILRIVLIMTVQAIGRSHAGRVLSLAWCLTQKARLLMSVSATELEKRITQWRSGQCARRCVCPIS